MSTQSLGRIQSHLYKLGSPEIPIFLLDAPEPVIFDAGISCAGKLYVEAIRSVLGDREPAFLFLTHVHWDHCGTAACLKKAFPHMKIAASHLSVNILKRPNAVALMKTLNEHMAFWLRSLPGIDSSRLTDEPFELFAIDIELQDNQVFELGDGVTVQVMATPGHTQDHMSYFLPNENILIAGEAAGVYYTPEAVTTEFVSGYDDYLASLQRLSALPVEVFCQGHFRHLIGREEIRAFFNRSISETVHFKARVLELLDEENGSIDQVVQRVKTERYDRIPDPKQPEAAYLLNARARVVHLAAKRG
ncbi:MAG: MBL fold metallo-hydrolase [Solirubrobacterales bacterium]